MVGAGPGGAACAALLAKQGMKTLLLEKNDRAGGKALTLSSKGFSYELWPVAGGPSRSSRWEELIAELELDVELLAPENPVLSLYRLPSGEYVPHQPLQAAGPTPPTPEESEGLSRFLNDMISLSPQEVDALDDVTWHEFVSRYQMPRSVRSSLGMQANILFVVPDDLLAASEMIKTMRDIMRGGATCYFKGGYGKIFEGCAKAVERYGGEVRLRTRVERIAIEEGQVRGVVTDKGTFHAPIVISNAGIQPTVLKLVGEEHFDRGYVNYVKDLVPSLGLMGIRYFLSKPVFERPMYLTFSDDNYWNVERAERAKAGQLPEDVLVFVTVPSGYDPSLAPAGKQCALAATLCPPGADMEDPQIFWDKLEQTVAKIWPELPQHIEHKEYYGTADVSAVTREHVLPGQGGECIGLGQIVGQCGQHKPSARAPIRGLFYVGTDAGGYGCGTHHGVDSAFKVAHMALQYHQMHQAAF
ncbi:hypothetical protein ES703_51464 [subsurface metagenome]